MTAVVPEPLQLVTRRHVIAVLVALAAMMIALIPPLWVRSTGDEVALALEPVDPLSLFRGNYVDLRYDIPIPATVDIDAISGDTVYLVFDGARPANVVAVDSSAPSLGGDQTCIRGRHRSGGVDLPELEQFFVTAEQGGVLERDLGDMVGIVKTTNSCRAVLVAIEPE